MRDRPTVDLIILAFAVTVCGFLLLAGAALTILAVTHPEREIRDSTEALFGAVTTIIGALLGLIAGRRTDTQPPH